jgi:hypothetical protein
MLSVLQKYECQSVVEVGVNVGKLAGVLVNNIKNLTWFGVDPWIPYEGNDKTGQASQKEMEQRFEQVKKLMKPFSFRAKILRESSVEASKHFLEGSIDAVIIDANHMYQHVKEDTEVWFPKVTKVMLWHDYGARQARLEGVKRAVDEFAEANDLRIISGASTVAWTKRIRLKRC